MIQSARPREFHVKHLQADSTDQVVALIGEMGLEVDRHKVDILVSYLDEVLIANESTNLTRVVESRSALRLHLLDSLTALPEINDAPSGVLLDLGSGGGFPGVPLAVATNRSAILLDSVSKKGKAVQTILEQLQLDDAIVVSSSRAEEYGEAHCGGAAVVVARAVSSLPSLVELASPLLMDGGLLVAMKGEPGDDELRSGARVARIVGFGEVRIRRLCLADGQESRTIISAVKERKSEVPLPRRNGMAQRSPLA
jgi:16S rRNA (guanine527-N7)-methyltransferase